MDSTCWSTGICTYCGYTKLVHYWHHPDQPGEYCRECVGYLSQRLNIAAHPDWPPVPRSALLPEPPRNPQLN